MRRFFPSKVISVLSAYPKVVFALSHHSYAGGILELQDRVLKLFPPVHPNQDQLVIFINEYSGLTIGSIPAEKRPEILQGTSLDWRTTEEEWRALYQRMNGNSLTPYARDHWETVRADYEMISRGEIETDAPWRGDPLESAIMGRYSVALSLRERGYKVHFTNEFLFAPSEDEIREKKCAGWMRAQQAILLANQYSFRLIMGETEEALDNIAQSAKLMANSEDLRDDLLDLYIKQLLMAFPTARIVAYRGFGHYERIVRISDGIGSGRVIVHPSIPASGYLTPSDEMRHFARLNRNLPKRLRAEMLLHNVLHNAIHRIGWYDAASLARSFTCQLDLGKILKIYVYAEKMSRKGGSVQNCVACSALKLYGNEMPSLLKERLGEMFS